jgi:23S rRNA (uracil1939-C5)-methyltransferase
MTLWHALEPHRDLFPARMTGLTLRLDRQGGLHVIAASPGEPWGSASRLQAALGEVGSAVVCWWHPTNGAPRVVAGPVTGYPATAFEQINPAMGEAARRWAVAQAGDVRDRTVWDLYAGVGDTLRLLADAGAVVVGVDVDEKAIGWARRRADLAPHRERVRLVAGRAEDVVPSLPSPHVVLVSPPRAGLHWDVTIRLTGAPVAHLIYVSCDPATLARDLHRLSATYDVRAIRGFDLFPQTAHVETVVHLVGAA